MPVEPVIIQDGRGKFLMPFGAAAHASRASYIREGGSILFSFGPGSYEKDKFFEEGSIIFPNPSNGLYALALVNIGLIGTETAGITFPNPSSGQYYNAIQNIGLIGTETAGITFPNPGGGQYYESLEVAPGSPYSENAGITFPNPSSGLYSL